jgi:carbohydrate diacid regulator
VSISIDEFERVAQAVARRISDLLSANAWVEDDTGSVLANKENVRGKLPSGSHPDEPGSYYLRVPLVMGDYHAEVVVSAPTNGETMTLRVAQTLAELMINQTLATAQLHNQRQLKDKFIHDVLRGVLTDGAEILREGQILGMDFTRPRAVLLIDASNYIMAPGPSNGREIGEERIARRTQTVISAVVRFFRLPSDTICAYIGEGEVAVLKASSTQDLAEWATGDGETQPTNPSWSNLAALKKASSALLSRLQHDTNSVVRIGIGRYHPGILGLARSHEDARAALSLGRRFYNDTGVYCLDEMGIAAFVGVSDEYTKIDLARYLLSPLDQEPYLLDTLKTFFDENCQPSVTANRLCIHRNTLTYRLDKAAHLSGLDPRRFNDAVQIRLALLLRTLCANDM